MSSRFQSLEKLPLFATEEAISAAVMGPGKTVEWRQIVPLLERRGFPTVDHMLGGRYVPAVKAFFDREYRINSDRPAPSRSGPENLSSCVTTKTVPRRA